MRAKHARDDRAVMGEIRPDARRALASRSEIAERASDAASLHLHRCLFAQQAAQETGSANSMSVSRPLSSTWKNLLMRLVSAQSSTSSSLRNDFSVCGRAAPVHARPERDRYPARDGAAACAPSAPAHAGGRRSMRWSQTPSGRVR